MAGLRNAGFTLLQPAQPVQPLCRHCLICRAPYIPSCLPSLNLSAAQIENPVRVLPLSSFCVGLKTAVLSLVRYQPDVQRAIDIGLAAAAAQQQDSLLQKLSGQPPPSPMSPRRQQTEMQQHQVQHQGSNGHMEQGQQRPAGIRPVATRMHGVQPMLAMSRTQC